MAVGGDLTVTGECVGCGSTVKRSTTFLTLTASKPMTATLADAGQLVLNGGAFDEDVSVLRVKTSANVETLSVTEEGEVWLGASGKLRHRSSRGFTRFTWIPTAWLWSVVWT